MSFPLLEFEYKNGFFGFDCEAVMVAFDFKTFVISIYPYGSTVTVILECFQGQFAINYDMYQAYKASAKLDEADEMPEIGAVEDLKPQINPEGESETDLLLEALQHLKNEKTSAAKMAAESIKQALSKLNHKKQ